MHQDTRDALDILTAVLSEQPEDALDALTEFDALPAVRECRRNVAQEDAAIARAERAQSRDELERTHRTRGRVGRTVPNGAGLKIGDTVYFNRRTTGYLLGLPVEVVGTNGASVNVKVPDEARYRRFRGQQAVRCPNTIVCKTIEEAIA